MFKSIYLLNHGVFSSGEEFLLVDDLYSPCCAAKCLNGMKSGYAILWSKLLPSMYLPLLQHSDKGKDMRSSRVVCSMLWIAVCSLHQEDQTWYGRLYNPQSARVKTLKEVGAWVSCNRSSVNWNPLQNLIDSSCMLLMSTAAKGMLIPPQRAKLSFVSFVNVKREESARKIDVTRYLSKALTSQLEV